MVMAGDLEIDPRKLIGPEVRFWRNQRGLTGAKLAKLAGLSPGMLTRIEQGKTAPSIQTLLSIATALSIPVSMFFHRMEKSRYVSYVPSTDRLKVDPQGMRVPGHIVEMLGHNVGHSLGIEPFHVTYETGSEPYSTFQEQGYKLVYILSGEVHYRHGPNQFPLKPGDTLLFDAMSPHGPAELIDPPVKLLVVNFYSRFDPEVR